MSRGTQVNNPLTAVLVDNISDGMVSINREGNKALLLKPGETGQLTWAEFVKAKNVPHFGRFIKLNDSVIISDGVVKIKNVESALNEDTLIEMLVQSTARLKEFTLSLNSGEQEVFASFLAQREKMGIEPEKCSELISFIDSLNSKEEQEVAKTEGTTAPKQTRKSKGKRIDNKHVIHENENNSSIHIDIDRESDS